ncbi:hypothetical protein KKA33_04535 [Patescibacteria group bacterium]|nr:hypothetical protein [Patescibacteria group bacterium]
MIKYIKKIDWKSYLLGVGIGIVIFVFIPSIFAKEKLDSQLPSNAEREVIQQNFRDRGQNRDLPKIVEDENEPDETQKVETAQRKKPKIPAQFLKANQ